METNALEGKVTQDGIIVRLRRWKHKYFHSHIQQETKQPENSLDYKLPVSMVNNQLRLLRQKVDRRRDDNHIHSREKTVPEEYSGSH